MLSVGVWRVGVLVPTAKPREATLQSTVHAPSSQPTRVTGAWLTAASSGSSKPPVSTHVGHHDGLC